jgi:hypothetical protein
VDEHGTWSTPEEERTFRSVRDLLMELHDRGSGIYIKPVREAEPYGVDGWVVGELSANGEQDLAVGLWLEQVVEAARAAAG